MCLPYSRFNGKIDGKTIYDFSNKLDYSLSQEERLKLVNEILNTYKTSEGDDLPDTYFEEVFEQVYDSENNNYDKSHVKLCLDSTDVLSENNNICSQLERMADYILYSPDAERITKRTKYNFYPKELFLDKINKETSLDEIAESIMTNEDGGDFNKDDVIDFLINESQNYKLNIEQKIFDEDLEDKELQCLVDYQNSINNLKEKIMQLKETNEKLSKNLTDENKEIIQSNYGLIKKAQKQINLMVGDQIDCKDMIKGTIYFKEVLKDSEYMDYDMFDFFDKRHVFALLKVHPGKGLNDDMGCLVYDLNQLIKRCNFTKTELKIIALYREDDSTQQSIAEAIGTSRLNIVSILNKITDKIIDTYEDVYEDWYYQEVVKGRYKKCSKCGKIKIANERHFRKRNDNKWNGLITMCRICEQEYAKSRK